MNSRFSNGILYDIILCCIRLFLLGNSRKEMIVWVKI